MLLLHSWLKLLASIILDFSSFDQPIPRFCQIQTKVIWSTTYSSYKIDQLHEMWTSTIKTCESQYKWTTWCVNYKICEVHLSQLHLARRENYKMDQLQDTGGKRCILWNEWHMKICTSYMLCEVQDYMWVSDKICELWDMRTPQYVNCAICELCNMWATKYVCEY